MYTDVAVAHATTPRARRDTRGARTTSMRVAWFFLCFLCAFAAFDGSSNARVIDTRMRMRMQKLNRRRQHAVGIARRLRARATR
jgi:hypothetical protein